MNKKVLIIIVAVVVVAAGGVVAFLMLSSGNSEAVTETVITYFPMPDSIATNTSDGKSLIKASIALGLANAPDVTEEFTEKMYVLRDVCIFALRSKTRDEMLDPGIQDSLKQEITTRLNEELSVDFIYTVYFNDLVIQ